MATKGKGKILKEQITFDFFETMELEKPVKHRKLRVEVDKPTKKELKPKQTIFRKQKCNVKPNHRKLNRKVRRIIRR